MSLYKSGPGCVCVPRIFFKFDMLDLMQGLYCRSIAFPQNVVYGWCQHVGAIQEAGRSKSSDTYNFASALGDPLFLI